MIFLWSLITDFPDSKVLFSWKNGIPFNFQPVRSIVERLFIFLEGRYPEYLDLSEQVFAEACWHSMQSPIEGVTIYV